MPKILHVIGARPNFIKVSPVINAIADYNNIEQKLIHTGQHYDENMSKIFFEQLGIPKPDINLEVGSASHSVQTAEIMIRFEEVVTAEKPDWVVVYGDVNSTVASALVCAKMNIPVAHVEAGLRSNDRQMPEEINRILTDKLSDLLFTPSSDGDKNLLEEGVSNEKIYQVGNVMIDTLVRMLPQIETIAFPNIATDFLLVTLHRPSNVDDPQMLRAIFETLNDISQNINIIFPMHPRTQSRLSQLGISINTDTFQIWEPVGYLEFLRLQQLATCIVTDSGGVQEESTFLQVPCLTLRKNTERPITITMGTNQLIGDDLDLLRAEVEKIIAGTHKSGSIPPLWDGKTGQRVAKVLAAQFS